MDCLVILESGNYAFKLCDILDRKGYIFDVIPTPCQISNGGCSYCVRFPQEQMDRIVECCRENKLKIEAVYKIIPMYSRNKYERIA